MKKLRFKPEKREPRILARVILALPLALSLGWMMLIGLRKGRGGAPGIFLAPPADTGMILTALAIFSIGYVVFLLMMFSEEIRDFFFKRHAE